RPRSPAVPPVRRPGRRRQGDDRSRPLLRRLQGAPARPPATGARRVGRAPPAGPPRRRARRPGRRGDEVGSPARGDRVRDAVALRGVLDRDDGGVDRRPARPRERGLPTDPGALRALGWRLVVRRLRVLRGGGRPARGRRPPGPRPAGRGRRLLCPPALRLAGADRPVPPLPGGRGEPPMRTRPTLRAAIAVATLLALSVVAPVAAPAAGAPSRPAAPPRAGVRVGVR